MIEAQPGDRVKLKGGFAVTVIALCEDPSRAWVTRHLFFGLVCYSDTPYVANLKDCQILEKRSA